ncbi:MAG TPA: aspartate/glutamate racemase family protein [bacterium]|nr:aspartate/glutamate racemase family protein [bacterium]
MGRHAIYGQAVGIIMQTDTILRLPGDVGNATTFPFPVRYEVVAGVDPADLKRPDRARAAASRFVDAARALERGGVRAIGTGCGYLALMQRELQRAVAVPVLSSSLVQVPWVAGMLPPGRRVGIVTADSRALDDAYFEPLGWTARTVPVAVCGIENERRFVELLHRDALDDSEIAEMHAAMARLVGAFASTHPDLGALVLECTNLPPFAVSMQRACGLPVFDVVTLLGWAHAGAVRRAFAGHL